MSTIRQQTSQSHHEACLQQARPLLTNANPTATDVETRRIVLEQYRIYVDLTDRLASRRSSANSFFLALNTAAVTVFGILWQDRPTGLSSIWIIVPLAVLLCLCGIWYLLIAHHRTVSGAKWAIIAAYEESLPTQPFSRAEWQGLLHSDKNRRWWRRITKLEQVVPLAFAGIYALGAILVLVTAP